MLMLLRCAPLSALSKKRTMHSFFYVVHFHLIAIVAVKCFCVLRPEQVYSALSYLVSLTLFLKKRVIPQDIILTSNTFLLAYVYRIQPPFKLYSI